MRSLSDFAHDAGAKVVAEGIETLDDARVRQAAVDYGQGWLFGRDRPASELRDTYPIDTLHPSTARERGQPGPDAPVVNPTGTR